MPEALHRSRANARGSPRPRRPAPHHGARGANARDAPTHGTRWGRHPALGTSWPSCARLGSLSRVRRPPGRRAGLPSEPVPQLSSESPAPREAGDSPGGAAATPREPAPRACDLPAPERRAHHLAPVLRRVGGTSLCHRDTSSAQWSGVHESGATPWTNGPAFARASKRCPSKSSPFPQPVLGALRLSSHASIGSPATMRRTSNWQRKCSYPWPRWIRLSAPPDGPKGWTCWRAPDLGWGRRTGKRPPEPGRA